MTRSRAIVTGFAAFFVSQVLTVIIHGFILVSDYEPFKGTLLRDAGRRRPARSDVNVVQ